MTDEAPRATVLITVTGPDRPGVTSTLFAALTRHGVDLLDVEQVVIRGRLTLGALVATDHDPEGLQQSVEHAMAGIAMQVQTRLEVDDDPATRRSSSHVVVVLGRPITARAFGEVARALSAMGANIDAIRRVADYPVTGLELAVSLAPAGTEAT
ncbi:MAG: ACT domain-containing protein, partial [Actinomycetota bacterium]|nr:ACT domain-containing protein [Actinomycetota bacterium]